MVTHTNKQNSAVVNSVHWLKLGQNFYCHITNNINLKVHVIFNPKLVQTISTLVAASHGYILRA